ncbi:phosphorylated adapter RNA export protein [Drosophila mojavensis]|uniref:Phosphorylated adapter RNA export protein n=1 Tax=Drosophila mojavensis TaxID=7230 RepID=B4KQJ3_DROMO|nr:phosphorylated adapter RNA export protein [Drosophila mojavensis]EDW08162.1 uncharacterized protein Dmoj_GI19804 [Drosophila mojavensis]
MMELQSNEDVDLEDGELSASGEEDIYTPLQRPAPASNVATAAKGVAESKVTNSLATCHQLQGALDDESQTNSEQSTSGESSEEGCIKKLRTENLGSNKKRKKRIKRTVMIRVSSATAEGCSSADAASSSTVEPNRARFKKYNIWTAALQEEALTENMRGCDVNHKSSSDRNVENYDFSLRYRLNGEHALKRRLSNSSDEGNSSQPAFKRGRSACLDSQRRDQRRPIKSRLGSRSRSRRGNSSTSGSSDNSSEPRHILDLQDVTGREPKDVANEMASKLYEEKDELLVRVVQILGLDLPLELYKETQRIEADGGMMINNGRRRRTPGGVFLFLLKHHNLITPAQQKSIFSEDRQNESKSRKQLASLIRDRKVEELKKCLSEKSTEMPSLNSRKELAQIQPGNLSNPPPSPVGQEQSSPEYRTHEININVVDNTDLPSTSKAATAAASLKQLISYDDDIIDVNCGEMDLF